MKSPGVVSTTLPNEYVKQLEDYAASMRPLESLSGAARALLLQVAEGKLEVAYKPKKGRRVSIGMAQDDLLKLEHYRESLEAQGVRGVSPSDILMRALDAINDSKQRSTE